MNKEKIRKEIFEKASLSARIIGLINDEKYLCPICGRVFSIKDIDNNKLTLEHIPPKAIGSHLFLLTCYFCNTVNSSLHDSHLAKREKILNFFSSLYKNGNASKESCKITIGEKTYNALVKIKNYKIFAEFSEKHNSPELIKIFNNEKIITNETIKITSMNIYNPDLSNLTELKIAFLYCFALMGYTYALHNNHEIVRRQLFNRKDRIISNFWYAKNKNEMSISGIAIVESSSIIFVIVYLERSKIILPYFSNGEKLYNIIEEELKKNKEISFNIKSIYKLPKKLEMNFDDEKYYK